MERLPGFRDFYPEPLPHADTWSADARQFIFDKWRETAKRYNFREYDGPPLEPLELFTTKSGEEIVGQLYNFTDKGERAVSLRPEMTPTLARMVAAHERNSSATNASRKAGCANTFNSTPTSSAKPIRRRTRN
jgi:histidyl-tRNA synthetase